VSDAPRSVFVVHCAVNMAPQTCVMLCEGVARNTLDSGAWRRAVPWLSLSTLSARWRLICGRFGKRTAQC
jgi:hypothetical protein